MSWNHPTLSQPSPTLEMRRASFQLNDGPCRVLLSTILWIQVLLRIQNTPGSMNILKDFYYGNPAYSRVGIRLVLTLEHALNRNNRANLHSTGSIFRPVIPCTVLEFDWGSPFTKAYIGALMHASLMAVLIALTDYDTQNLQLCSEFFQVFISNFFLELT